MFAWKVCMEEWKHFDQVKSTPPSHGVCYSILPGLIYLAKL